MGSKSIDCIILNNQEDITIYAFDKARTTNDMRWMVEGYTGREKVEEFEDKQADAQEAFYDVLDWYCIETGSNKSADYYELIVEVEELRLDYEISKALLGTLITEVTYETFIEVTDELRHRNMFFNEEKEFSTEFERLERQLRQRKTKLDRKQSELNQFEEKTEEGQSIKIGRQKVKIERILGLKINLKETYLNEWVDYLKEAEEVSKENKQWQSN